MLKKTPRNLQENPKESPRNPQGICRESGRKVEETLSNSPSL